MFDVLNDLQVKRLLNIRPSNIVPFQMSSAVRKLNIRPSYIVPLQMLQQTNFIDTKKYAYIM